MNEENWYEKRYLNETIRRLQQAGFDTEYPSGEGIAVSLNGNHLCQVVRPGAITYRNEDLLTPELEAAKERVYENVCATKNYMNLMSIAPPLKAVGLEDKYQCLVEFNGAVLAGMESKYGVQFVTWERDFKGDGVCYGHYYNSSFEEAKKDFAVRAGLIDKKLLFSKEQLTEIYLCCNALKHGCDVSYEQQKTINSVLEQIEDYDPQLVERINQQYQEQEAQQLQEPTM